MMTTKFWTLVALAAAAVIFTTAVVAEENEPQINVDDPITIGLDGKQTNTTMTPAGEDPAAEEEDVYAHSSGHPPLPVTDKTRSGWPNAGPSVLSPMESDSAMEIDGSDPY